MPCYERPPDALKEENIAATNAAPQPESVARLWVRPRRQQRGRQRARGLAAPIAAWTAGTTATAQLPVDEDAAVTRMPCAPSLPQGGRHCIIPYDTPYLCFLLSLTMHGTLAHSLIMLVRAPTGASGLPALICFLLWCLA